MSIGNRYHGSFATPLQFFLNCLNRTLRFGMPQRADCQHHAVL
jgi:hypothetical protein